MTFNMKDPTLKNNIDEFKPIFKSWNEVSQNVSTIYMTNSLGEMAFWHDESLIFYLHDICTTSIAASGQRHVNHPPIDHPYKCHENTNHSRVPQLSKAPIPTSK